MSDCFDHELDAFEQAEALEWALEEVGPHNWLGRVMGSLECGRRRPFDRIPSRPSGEGPCPKCGAKTRFIEGKTGPFYGCVKYPECRGSRGPTTEEQRVFDENRGFYLERGLNADGSKPTAMERAITAQVRPKKRKG